MRSILLAPFVAVASMTPLSAQLVLPHVFGSHMVLQRDTTVPVFGSATPGGRVEVFGSWPNAEKVRATADEHGRFRVDLKTGAAGGPYRLTIAAGNEAVRLEDVLLGEVWLCSGQSNMEFELRSAEGGDAAIAAADRPRIRLFQVRNTIAPAPLRDVDGEWVPSTHETARAFSAVGFFFACDLEARLNVPIGIVQSDWGGTPAEAWTRGDALAAFPEFKPALDRMAAMTIDPSGRARQQERMDAEWRRAVHALDAGFPGPGHPLGFASMGLDDSDWTTLPVPGLWAGTTFADFDGVLWYRRTIDIPTAWRDRDLVVELGTIDDDDDTFFDGVGIGATRGWDVERNYRVPARVVRGGSTTLAVRVHDTGGEGGFGHAAPRLRVRLAEDEKGESAIPLAGDWHVKRGVSNAELPPRPRLDNIGPGDPGSLWNGMIAPLLPFAFKGALWYQGESNVSRYAQYRALFPAMITDWRRQFGRGDFPFYFVQIAPFGYGNDEGQAALLRDAQRRVLDLLPNVGMAVTMDIGDPRDIHPRNKSDVGSRLARWALARCYGQDVECSGPLFAGLKPEGARLRVRFTHAKGLRTRSGAAPRFFELAGSDGKWHAATATIDGESILLEAAGVGDPVDARYAFGAADEPDLENSDGLPAASFVASI